jgi:Secretion system C-terminal sorting domain
MKKQTFTIPVSILCLSIIFFLSTPVQSQGVDESRIDHLTPADIQNYVPSNPSVDVITIDGWDNYDMGIDFAEPHASVNPNDILQYFNAYNINNAHRTYDGFTWTPSSPNFGGSVAGDPVTAYDSLGNLYYMSLYGGISGAKVLHSTDNGATWGTAVVAIAGGDKCWMAADQTGGPYANYLYASITNISFTGQSFARSTNFGASFTTTFTASNSPLPGAMVAVGPNTVGGDVPGGCVYFVTNSGSAFASIYGLYLSTDGGSTFTLKSTNFFSNYVGTNVSGRNSVQNMRTRPYPFITADNSYGPYRGRLYLFYASNNPPGDTHKPDVYCRYSTDQGATWSGAVTVNDDQNSQNNNQWHPSIWCDKVTGRLFVKWMDTRDTPTSDSALIYASYSDDGGQTFAPNQRVSNMKMKINCTTCGGGGTPSYQGDYDAVTSYGSISQIVWTDFRNGNFGSYSAYFPDYALLVTPASATIYNDADTTYYDVNVPATTLYDQDAIFSATVTPTPSQGTIDLSFDPSNIISTFPGSIQLRVVTSGQVTVGTYTVHVLGTGPNGIPVHKRDVELDVQPFVPVELTSFTAQVVNNNVNLLWQTATETNNKGFEIERASITNANLSQWNQITFVPGNGTTTEPNNYSYSDKNIHIAGNYAYRLKQIDFDGSYKYSNSVEVEVSKPLSFALEQNYPNPFNPTTTISYSIPKDEFVELKVYDALGNEVSTLANGKRNAGSYKVTFDAGSLASGVYYYKIRTSDFVQVKKMLLLK